VFDAGFVLILSFGVHNRHQEYDFSMQQDLPKRLLGFEPHVQDD
jgi:hypothetical protein